jgi:ribosomal protein L37AE/L43A
MTIEVNERTYYRTAETLVKAAANHSEKRREWITCPRCIGGNMYRDNNGEYVCIQCGCSYYPGRVTKTHVRQSQNSFPVIGSGVLSD